MCEEVGEAPPINLFVVVAMPQANSWQPKSNRQELTRQTRITALPSNPVGTWGPLLTPFLQQDQADTVRQKRPQICPEPLRHTKFWGRRPPGWDFEPEGDPIWAWFSNARTINIPRKCWTILWYRDQGKLELHTALLC